MSQTSVLPKIKITDAVGKKSYIPLEHNVYSTQRVGKIVPYMVKYVDANGKHKIDLETLNYMAPMVAPTVGDIRLKHWLYWIPFSRLSENLANMLAKQKAVKYDGSEFDVHSVPNIRLDHLTMLCMIGSFCTIYYKDKLHAPPSVLPTPWQDGNTYLWPSNYRHDDKPRGLYGLENIWNQYTGGDFISYGAFPPAGEERTLLFKDSSRLLGGMTAWIINAKYLTPLNDLQATTENMFYYPIPLANPTPDSFLDWRTPDGKPMYDGTHLDETHGIDCSPVSLENPDYCVNRSFTLNDGDGNSHDVTVTFAFRFSDFGRALRDIIIASGDQLDISSNKRVSFLPFIATYLAYFYAQPLVKYKNWQNTAAYKIMTRYTTANVTDMSDNMRNLQNNDIDANLFVEFINDLASMWAIEPQDFVSAHTREPFTSPLAFNNLDSFINSVAEGVSEQDNPSSVPINMGDDSRDEPSSIVGNNQPYINNINHDVTTASLLQRVALRMAVNSIIGRPIRKLLRSMGYGDWLDNCAPQMVDYGELRLNLKPVVSTSDTSSSDGRGADLGQLGGRGYGHNYHKSKPFANKEPGFFVLLTSVYVNSGYCQAIDAANYCVEADDFYKRDFDSCGFEIDEKNLVHGSLTWVEENDGNKLNESFGFAPRSMKFKTISNKLLGDFTDGEKFDVYSPYHLEKLLPVGKRSINEQKEVELVEHYKFTRVNMGSRFSPSDVPIAGNIWRYLGRFPWLGQFDRIFKLYDYDVRKIQGVFGLESDNFFELVSKIYSYFVSTPENYVFLNTIHYDSWQDKKPIAESFGTLSEIFNGGANASEVKA